MKLKHFLWFIAICFLAGVVVGLLGGCQVPPVPETVQHATDNADVVVYTPTAGTRFVEFRLTDGTRCVSNSYDGGMACDWEGRRGR